jgi:hypothetical protein
MAARTDLRSCVNGLGGAVLRRARVRAGGERLEARKAEERSLPRRSPDLLRGQWRPLTSRPIGGYFNPSRTAIELP